MWGCEILLEFTVQVYYSVGFLGLFITVLARMKNVLHIRRLRRHNPALCSVLWGCHFHTATFTLAAASLPSRVSSGFLQRGSGGPDFHLLQEHF